MTITSRPYNHIDPIGERSDLSKTAAFQRPHNTFIEKMAARCWAFGKRTVLTRR